VEKEWAEGGGSKKPTRNALTQMKFGENNLFGKPFCNSLHKLNYELEVVTLAQQHASSSKLRGPKRP